MPATQENEQQLKLIDTDHPAAKKILAAIKRIRGHDEDRSAAQEKGTKAREDLIEILHEAKLSEFRIGGYVVKLREKAEKVSVRQDDDEETDGD